MTIVSVADKNIRPVILLAPLADSLIKKLVAESPDKYSTGQPSKYNVLKLKQ